MAKGLHPEVRAWWRRLLRACLVGASLLAVAALSHALFALLGPGRVERLGHAHRALRLEPLHLALALPAGLLVAAVWAGRGGRRGRSLALAAVALFGVGAMELTLRVQNARQYVKPYPRLGWWYGPDPLGRIRSDLTPGRWISPEGLAGREPTPYRWPAARVLCLGDSFTWGHGLSESQGWPAFAARRAGVPFLNAAVPGYGTDQMATAYADELEGRFDHTAVLVGAIHEDAMRATERYMFGFPKPFTPVGGDVQPIPSPSMLLGLAVAPESQLLRPWRENGRHALRALGLLPDAWDHLAADLRRIRARAGARPCYFLAFSSTHDGGRHLARMVETARAAGFDGAAAVDLGPDGGPLVLPHDGHPSVAGQERIAEAALALVAPALRGAHEAPPARVR